MPKHQREEQRFRPKDIDKMHQLRDLGVSRIHICERFGINELDLIDIFSRPWQPRQAKWCVRWYDEEGERHEKAFETFRAAKMYHSRLKRVEWSKIEPV